MEGDDRASLVASGELSVFTYVLDDYNRFYLNQLYELLTQYGPIAEVWLDGANPTGTAQVYDYSAWFDLIRRLAPEATIAVGGPDVRWVGNESGYARESEWSVVPFTGVPSDLGRSMVAGEEADQVAGLPQLLKADYLRWYPAEVDVSIRPGWFYHAEEDGEVKSVAELLDIYRKSVGRNAVLLLNVPPDRRGLFAETDAARLTEFGATVRTAYGIDLSDSLPAAINVIGLSEDITQGQLVESFAVDAFVRGEWTEIVTGTTIGHRRLLPLPELIEPTAVRLRVLSSRADAAVTLSLHFDPTV